MIDNLWSEHIPQALTGGAIDQPSKRHEGLLHVEHHVAEVVRLRNASLEGIRILTNPATKIPHGLACPSKDSWHSSPARGIVSICGVTIGILQDEAVSGNIQKARPCMGSDGTLTGFFVRLQSGEQSAARGLWEHFCPRLTGLARRVFRQRPDRFPEAEDAALSAFASFCNAARDGKIAKDVDRDSLWRLLKTFTVRKVARAIERDNTAKRGGGRVVAESVWAGNTDNAGGLDAAFGTLPTQDFDLHCEELITKLADEELGTIALAKLMGYTNKELAERFECTERRIERKLHAIRQAWENEIPSPDGPSGV